MKKFMRRYEIWKEWSKVNTDGRIHHILVLFGLRKSPTFDLYLPMKELGENINKAFQRAGEAVNKFEEEYIKWLKESKGE